MSKQLLFSVTKKDLVRQTFCTGGNGGQHRNATQNGVRFIHPPSGASGEARDSRDQPRNEKSAFLRMANSPAFQKWLKIESARRMGQPVAETPEQVMARVDTIIRDGMKDGSIVVEELAGEA